MFPDLLERGASHPLLAEWVSVLAGLTADSEQVTVREVEADGRFFLQTNYYLPQLRRVRVYLADITERKRAEEALRENRQQLQAIIDGATETVVFVKDVEGRFITVNAAFEKLLGIKRDELQGKTDYDIVSKGRADSYRAAGYRKARRDHPHAHQQ